MSDWSELKRLIEAGGYQVQPWQAQALIAENEENGANSAQWQKAFVRIAGELSVLAAQHGDFTDESTLQQAIDFLKGAMAERDRLKDEMERVRADAERYRLIRRVANHRGWTDEQFDKAFGTGGRADV